MSKTYFTVRYVYKLVLSKNKYYFGLYTFWNKMNAGNKFPTNSVQKILSKPFELNVVAFERTGSSAPFGLAWAAAEAAQAAIQQAGGGSGAVWQPAGAELASARGARTGPAHKGPAHNGPGGPTRA